MRRPLLFLALLFAIADIWAETAGLRPAVYLLKPLATLSLAALVLGVRRDTPYRTWIAAGLLASLAGDILLMLPQGLFVPGLIAFLLAHLCYIRAFAVDGAGLRAPWLPALPVYAIAVAVLAYLWPSLGAMRVPVACYVAVISTMSWQAIARWRMRPTMGTALAAAGSVLFMISDCSLAIRRFVSPFAGATFVIMATYFTAQWLLALSVSDDDVSLAP